MTKENVFAARDIKKGESLINAVQRAQGYFYFVTREGTMLRAPLARKPLTPEERAVRDREALEKAKAIAARRAVRTAARLAKRAADEKLIQEKKASKAARIAAEKAAKQAAIDAKIARLQSKKQNL